MAKSLQVLFLVGFFSLAVWAKPSDFWKLESERQGETSVSTFSAKNDPAKGQGLLMWGSWSLPEAARGEPIDPSLALAGLYKDLKQFHLLGRKDVAWGDRQARLVAFRATVDKRPVVARALVWQGPEEVQVLLLVSHPEAQKDFTAQFNRLQKQWDFSRPASANVIYSPGEAKPQ